MLGWRFSRPSSRRSVFLLPALLLLAFAVRLVGLGRADLGMDGGLSLAMASMGPGEVFLISERDVHPPLYYLLLHYWMLLAGMTPFAAKFLSAIFSLLGVAVLYALGRRLGRPGLGASVALLMAISPLSVVNAAAVRDFVAAGFFAILSTYAFLGVLHADGDRNGKARAGRWAALVAAHVAGLLTSYLALGVLAAQLLYVLLRPDLRRNLWRWLGMLAATAVLFAPWGWVAVASTLEKVSNRQAPRPFGGDTGSAGAFAADALRHLTVNEWVTFTPGPVEALYLAVLLLGLLLAWQRRRSGQGKGERLPSAHDGLVLLALAVSLILTYAIVQLWLRLPLPSRYLVVVSPFFLLLVARGLDSLAQSARLLSVLALAGIAVSALLSLRDFDVRPPLPPSFWDPQGLVAYLDAKAADGDGLIFITLEQAGYYNALSNRHLPWYYFIVGPEYLEADLGERVERVLPAAASRHDALWLAFYQNGIAPSSRQITGWLNRNTFPSGSKTLNDTMVVRYGADREDLRRSPVNANFGNLILLADAGFTERVEPSEQVRISLTWKVTGKIGADYTVFVHFLDDQGKRWAQKDASPLNGEEATSGWQVGEIFRDRRAIELPASLPAGRYWLDLGLYAGNSRLELAGGGNVVRLGPISFQ